MCCNHANGRVDFEDGWLIKSSFITKDEHEACQLNQDQSPTNKKNQKNILTNNCLRNCLYYFRDNHVWEPLLIYIKKLAAIEKGFKL
jgi:hypothetical protein